MDLSYQIQSILTKAGNPINGHDSEDLDITYSSIVEWNSSVLYNDDKNNIEEEMVDASLAQPLTSLSLRKEWYKSGHDYYEDERKCPATIDGVLGGFAHLSPRDLKGSKQFLQKLKSMRPDFKVTNVENDGVDTYALECGAGE